MVYREYENEVSLNYHIFSCSYFCSDNILAQNALVLRRLKYKTLRRVEYGHFIATQLTSTSSSGAVIVTK